MFDHNHHQKIHLVLDSLNPDIFSEVGAYFGGGTLITLLNDEYRWSKDIDLAILRQKGPISEKAIRKAKNAYPVIPELKKALHKFIENNQYRRKCFLVLEIEDQGAILQGINLLSQDMGLGITIP